MITKQELEQIFKKWYPGRTISSYPFYNERMPENGYSIRIAIFEGVIWYVYLRINENGFIKNIESNKKDFMEQLIGKQIDLNSYNGKIIDGNYTMNNGVVQDGKFKLNIK